MENLQISCEGSTLVLGSRESLGPQVSSSAATLVKAFQTDALIAREQRGRAGTDFPESISAVLVQGHRAVVVGLAWAPTGAENLWSRIDPIEVYGPRAFSGVPISIGLCCVGGNVFVAKAVGAENLPAVGGIWMYSAFGSRGSFAGYHLVSLQHSERAF